MNASDVDPTPFGQKSVSPQNGPELPGLSQPGAGQTVPGQRVSRQPVPGQILPGQILPGQLGPGQIARAVAFHGHHCPGLSFGLRAAVWALAEMGSALDEEVVTITETDMCAVDAIQALVGCTFGKGNLIHRPYGKVAFTFFRRQDGRGVRLVQNPTFRERHLPPGTVSPEARQTFIDAILNAPFAELYSVGPAREALPSTARIQRTLICQNCGEGVMESCVRLREGKTLCLSCIDH